MHVILAQGYTNPVIDSNNPDPSAIALPDGGYLAVATSNHASVSSGEDAFPIYYSDNLVDWELKGHVFPSGLWPGYCDRNMWAPEIHHVNGRLIFKMQEELKNALILIGSLPISHAVLQTAAIPLELQLQKTIIHLDPTLIQLEFL